MYETLALNGDQRLKIQCFLSALNLREMKKKNKLQFSTGIVTEKKDKCILCVKNNTKLQDKKKLI